MIDLPSPSVSTALPLASSARFACTSAKLVNAGKADQVDLVVRGVEVVDDVVADRLGEHEQVVAGRAGQVVVARQGEDRVARRDRLRRCR